MAEVITMPKLGFDMAEGILVRWVKGEDEQVEKGEVLAEIETDKATVEVESIISGVVRKHIIDEGTAAPVGAPIAVIGEAAEEIDLEAILGEVKEAEPVLETQEPIPEPTPAMSEPTPPAPEIAVEGRLPDGVRASPVARRLAAEHGLDLRTISGTGPGGRIVKQDVESSLKEQPVRLVEAVPYLPPSERRETERIQMSKLRGIIGRRMTAAKQQLPHFYVTIDLDAAPMMTLRSELNSMLPEGEKISVNDFIVKGAALSLREFPNLNASLDGDEIIHHGEINIGVAVAVEDGLLTIVMRDADLKPLRLISNETRQIVARARAGRVRPEDIEGSTFTVSNMGMFDVDHFIAIINPPEAAILAVGSVQDVPVIHEGVVIPGQRMKCTLSADHRITDGAEAARWLQVFKNYIERPLHLLLPELLK
ncbi:MAG: 2-oxo acid dehydrogenase subunit E2 [Anaerolineaceae bacterium]|nr:MAG: 2-oxo acid dehydrogenase subunit E2 [Anaerolineaceae bacterium]